MCAKREKEYTFTSRMQNVTKYFEYVNVTIVGIRVIDVLDVYMRLFEYINVPLTPSQSMYSCAHYGELCVISVIH